MIQDIINFIQNGILKIVMLVVTYVFATFSSSDSPQNSEVFKAFNEKGYEPSEMIVTISKIESNIEQLLVFQEE